MQLLCILWNFGVLLRPQFKNSKKFPPPPKKILIGDRKNP